MAGEGDAHTIAYLPSGGGYFPLSKNQSVTFKKKPVTHYPLGGGLRPQNQPASFEKPVHHPGGGRGTRSAKQCYGDDAFPFRWGKRQPFGPLVGPGAWLGNTNK
jgi:hypothetical protein